MSPARIRVAKDNALPEDVYVMLARRAREVLLNDPSCQPPKYGWRTKVYYARIEANGKLFWKIGVTSNKLESRYCRADRRIMVEVRFWQYETREEAEAVEREILAEFANALYKGAPVLRSGGDSELFTRDVLNLDCEYERCQRISSSRIRKTHTMGNS